MRAALFALIFAIIAGAVILFIAIFATTKFIEMQGYRESTEMAQQLDILLDPLETSVPAAKFVEIEMPFSEIKFGCYGNKQTLQVSISKFGKMQEFGKAETQKFVYGKNERGKKLFIFSKPFEMPYKVADFVFVTFSSYNFVDAPENIEEEIEELKMNFLSDKEGKKVCFEKKEEQKECDIFVEGLCNDCYNKYEYGYVEKNGEKIFYVGDALLYAAILSSKQLYECNLKRVLEKTSFLASLFAEKAKILDEKGCYSISAELEEYAKKLKEKLKEKDITDLYDLAKDIEEKNFGAICKAF